MNVNYCQILATTVMKAQRNEFSLDIEASTFFSVF